MLFVSVPAIVGDDDAIILSNHVPISLPFPMFFVINWNIEQFVAELKVNCREYKPVNGTASLQDDVYVGVQLRFVLVGNNKLNVCPVVVNPVVCRTPEVLYKVGIPYNEILTGNWPVIWPVTLASPLTDKLDSNSDFWPFTNICHP